MSVAPIWCLPHPFSQNMAFSKKALKTNKFWKIQNFFLHFWWQFYRPFQWYIVCFHTFSGCWYTEGNVNVKSHLATTVLMYNCTRCKNQLTVGKGMRSTQNHRQDHQLHKLFSPSILCPGTQGPSSNDHRFEWDVQGNQIFQCLRWNVFSFFHCMNSY